MILHQRHERSGSVESGTTYSYGEGSEGRPSIITIESFDNYDDPGRPPGRFETEHLTVDQFLERFGHDHPAVQTYREFILGVRPDAQD